MLSKKASKLIVFGTLIGFFIIGSILAYKDALKRPDKVYEVSSPKLEVPAPRIEPITTTEKLFALARANIRGGPGKDYKAIATLGLFEEVEFEKEFAGDGKWRKLVFPRQGYVFHTLVGSKFDARKIIIQLSDRFVQSLVNAGVITKIDGWTIYVDRYAWIELGKMTTTPFIRQYGLDLRLKQPGQDIIIEVIDYFSGRKILSYRVKFDLFFMN